MANPPYVPGGMKPGVAKTVTNHAPAARRKDVPAPQAKPGSTKVTPRPAGGVKKMPVPSGPKVKPPKSPGYNAGSGVKPPVDGSLDINAYLKGIYDMYAPQETALATTQANRQAALKSMVTEFLGSLNNIGAQLQPYTNAASQQTSDANNAAAALAASNPNAVTQNDLAAINAPQAQRDQVAGMNSTAFGGNAALLRYAGGVIPSDQFRSDAASRAAYLSSLPDIGESIGVRGVTALSNLASQENLKLAGSKAGDLMDARNYLATYAQKQQELKAAAAKTAFDENATNTRLDQGQQSINARNRANAVNAAATKVRLQQGQTRLQQGQDRLDLSAQMDAFNQKYKISTLKMSASRLDLSARRFAQSTLNSDRSYGLQLQRIGISKKSLQLRALQQEYKLKNGGFTPSQINRFRTDADFVATQAQSAKSLPSFNQAMAEMFKRHVPVSLAIKKLNSIGYTIPTPKQASDYNRMTGVSSSGPLAGPYGKITVAPSADRPGASTSSAVKAFVAHVANVAGVPLTIGTGTNHNEYVEGTSRVSDHWAGNAADVPASGAQLTRIGQAALIAAGANPSWARKQTGGLFNLNTKAGRIQVIFNSMEGGNHFNHLHVGVRP